MGDSTPSACRRAHATAPQGSVRIKANSAQSVEPRIVQDCRCEVVACTDPSRSDLFATPVTSLKADIQSSRSKSLLQRHASPRPLLVQLLHIEARMRHRREGFNVVIRHSTSLLLLRGVFLVLLMAAFV